MTEQRYTFKLEQGDGTVVTLSGNRIILDGIIEDFKDFLRVCTFSQELIDSIGRVTSKGEREYED